VQQAHIDGGGGSVGALIALKRNHVMAVSHPAPTTLHQQPQQQQQQQHHSEIIYEELPTDYSGHMEAGEEECVTADVAAAKRPKYVSEVL